MKYIFVFALSIVCSDAFAKLIPDPTFSPTVKTPTFACDHPQICFDQGHMNMGVGDGRHDPVLKLLESDGYKIKILSSKIEGDTLKDCQIFYVSSVMAKNEGESGFVDDEISIVETWVKEGGSLLLMTDHPKMFAMAAEKLANAFGVYGSIKTVEDPKHSIAALKDPTVIRFSKSQLNKKHPIIKGRNKNENLKTVIAFTGQSIKGPTGSQSVLKFSKQATEKTEKFADTSAKGLTAMLTLEYGSGRVVVTGDGTYFSSKTETDNGEKYGINRENTDNVQLALNTFHWLSRILK